MAKKKGEILILLIVLAVFFLSSNSIQVDAAVNFSEQNAYDWLISKGSTNGAFNNNIFDTSLSILAFNLFGDTISEDKSMGWINSQKNTAQYCWPGLSCKVKDTAAVLLVMNSLGSENIAEVEDWLTKSQSGAFKSGEWLLEIATSDTGSCKVTYEIGKLKKEHTLNVNKGYFPGCGNTTFLDLNTCFSTDLVNRNPSLVLSIDCSTLSGEVVMTLLYRAASSYYILNSLRATVADIRVNNGCFGKGFGGACEVESSLYANWALYETRSEVNTLLYLKESYDPTKIIDNALMYLIKGSKTYLESLKTYQKSDGSWNKNAYETALALLALKKDSTYQLQIDNGITWLKDNQKSDGSWGDVKSTAMVLYAAFPEASIQTIESPAEPTCTDGIENQDERGVDCGGVCEEFDDCCNNEVQDEEEDGIDCGGVCEECEPGQVVVVCNEDDVCDWETGEDVDNCPIDCEDTCANEEQDGYEEGVDCGGPCPDACPEAEVCYPNGICEYDDYGENAINCPEDCSCGDGVCDDTESFSSCADDCEEGGELVTGCDTDEDCLSDEECIGGTCQLKEAGPTTFCGDETCDEDEDEEICPEDCKGFPWLIILIVILLLGVGGFFFYKKFLTPPKKKEEGGVGGIFGGGGLPGKPEEYKFGTTK